MTTLARKLKERRSRRRSDDGAMPLVEHLAELRRRLVVSLLALAVGAVVAFALYNRILDFLIGPYCELAQPPRPPGPCSLFISDPLEGFAARLKVATYVGLFLASPVVLYQLWRFVTPGLNPNEKRYAGPFVISSIALFCVGVLIAKLTFPRALDFLVGVGGPDITAIFSPSKYLRLILLMVVAIGVAFEFPVLLVFLQVVGV